MANRKHEYGRLASIKSEVNEVSTLFIPNYFKRGCYAALALTTELIVIS